MTHLEELLEVVEHFCEIAIPLSVTSGPDKREDGEGHVVLAEQLQQREDVLPLRVELLERFEDSKVLMTLIPFDYKANKNVLALCGAGGEEDLALCEARSVKAERRAYASNGPR